MSGKIYNFTAVSVADTSSPGVVRQNTIQYASANVQITKRIMYNFTQDAEWNRLTDEIARLKVDLKSGKNS